MRNLFRNIKYMDVRYLNDELISTIRGLQGNFSLKYDFSSKRLPLADLLHKYSSCDYLYIFFWE